MFSFNKRRKTDEIDLENITIKISNLYSRDICSIDDLVFVTKDTTNSFMYKVEYYSYNEDQSLNYIRTSTFTNPIDIALSASEHINKVREGM